MNIILTLEEFGEVSLPVRRDRILGTILSMRSRVSHEAYRNANIVLMMDHSGRFQILKHSLLQGTDAVYGSDELTEILCWGKANDLESGNFLPRDSNLSGSAG